MATKMKMKMKSNDGDKKAITVAAPLWARVVLAVGTDVDQDLRVPRGTLRRLVALARALEAHAGDPLAPVALERLREARQVAEAITEHHRQAQAADLAGPRQTTVSQVATVTGMLAVAGRSLVPEVAEAAAAVRAAAFDDEATVALMGPQEVWVEVDRVRERLAHDEGLREALLGFVPEPVVTAVFAANDALGVALGRRAERVPVRRKLVQVFLRRRIAHYVRCVAATGFEEDLVSVQRMEAALAPLRDMRAANAKRRGPEEEEEEEVEDAEAADETDAPPRPPPGGGDTG